MRFVLTDHHIFSSEFWLTAGQGQLAAVLTTASQTNLSMSANLKPSSKMFYYMNQGPRCKGSFEEKGQRSKILWNCPFNKFVNLTNLLGHRRSKSVQILYTYSRIVNFVSCCTVQCVAFHKVTWAQCTKSEQFSSELVQDSIYKGLAIGFTGNTSSLF
jgi:hypothetical protein